MPILFLVNKFSDLVLMITMIPIDNKKCNANFWNSVFFIFSINKGNKDMILSSVILLGTRKRFTYITLFIF